MLYFTRWRALGIILTALIVCLCAVPNFFPEAQVKTWPAWAQRRLVLGLDLQGGSYLLLEVDGNYVKKERLDQIRDEGRRVLRDNKIGFTGGFTVRNDAVEVRITKGSDLPEGIAGQDREDGIPDGRCLRAAGSGAAGQVTTGIRTADERVTAAHALCGQEAGAGRGRRPDGRPGELRPAHE